MWGVQIYVERIRYDGAGKKCYMFLFFCARFLRLFILYFRHAETSWRHKGGNNSLLLERTGTMIQVVSQQASD